MKIRLLELCAGYGSQALALKNLGIEVYSEIAEFDKYASQAYMQLHGETKNYGDIYTIDESKLPYFDMITYSTPCFTEDSLVLTEKRGFQKIIDIQIGEKVITHDGNYKTVENVINNGKKKTVKIYGMGIDEIHTTPNHLFYVREKSHVWNNKTRSYTRVFSEPVWKQADSLKRTDYMGIPINKKSEIPEWNGITFVWSDGRKDRYKNQLSQYMNNKDFWWLIGRYIADGWFRNNGGIIIGCGKKKFVEMKEKCDSIGLNYNILEERTVIKFYYQLKELELFVQSFGKYAYGKKIPSFVMDLPVDLLNSFLNGKARAKADKKTIVLPESEDRRTYEAAAQILKEDLANLIIIGSEEAVKKGSEGLDVSKATIVDPEKNEKTQAYVDKLVELRAKKGMTPEKARETILNDYTYYGVMMVKMGDADGLVSGACHSTANTLRPCLQILKTKPGTKLVSAFFLMVVPDCEYGDDGVFVFGDCGLNQNPNPEELAAIAESSAESYRLLLLQCLFLVIHLVLL